jgi:hypothetical protein
MARKVKAKAGPSVFDKRLDVDDGGSFEIVVNDDQTISYKSHFKKGRGSLEAIGASGLVPLLNKLTVAEMAAVIGSVKVCPFPLGGEDRVYAASYTVAHSKAVQAKLPGEENVGKIRKALCLEACGSFNGPKDTYIRAAVKYQEEHGSPAKPQVSDPRQGSLF